MSALQRDMTAELAALPDTTNPACEFVGQLIEHHGFIDYAHQLRGADKGIRRLRRKADRLQAERDELKLANDKLGAQNEILRKALAKRRVASPEEFAKQW